MKLSKALMKALGADMPKGKKQKLVKGDSPAVALFLKLCEAHGLPPPTPEYEFHPVRKWAVDFCFEGFVCLEVEGGIWTQGRHTRGKGFLADIEKYNELALLGFMLLRCTPAEMKSGAACALVKRGLESLGEQS